MFINLAATINLANRTALLLTKFSQMEYIQHTLQQPHNTLACVRRYIHRV